MKKISLGSFPLIEISGKDRKIFESYLIKVVSDLITANQLSNSIYMDRANFVTPLSILKFIKEDQKDLIGTKYEPGKETQQTVRDRKARVIKNAFRNTKQLYRAIASDPFYKSHLFYPIYIEEPIKSNYGYMDYNYDFLILSNDLIKQQLLDEIIFDDKITMLFLVLKCLLTPEIKITDVGITNTGKNFRKYFSLFLETCKNENINPFEMFIRIIKAAGKQKRSKVSNALGKLNNVIMGGVPDKVSSLYHSKSFINLFNTEGEIKSAEFLLNTSMKEVNNFLKDTPTLDKNYNPMLRQYAQAKTHEYGKILSIIDSLGSFNRSSNVISELNSSTMLSHVKVDEQTTLMVNKDVIISELETIYFRSFLEDLKFLEQQAVAEAKIEIKNKLKIDILASDIETKEKVQTKINTLTAEMSKVGLALKSAKAGALAMARALGFQTFEDINVPRYVNTPEYKDTKNDLSLQMALQKNIQDELNLLQSKLGKLPKENTIEKDIQNKKLSLTVNLEIYQAQLTAAYSEIYQFIYSKDFDNELKEYSGKKINIQDIEKTLFSNKYQDINMLKTTLMEISEDFILELENKLKFELLSKYKINNFNFNNAVSKKLKYENILNIILKNIFIPIYTKYSNKAISEANRLKDLKTNNNPLMKKILSRDSLFKAYILTSDTLIESYELLHYIDTIKFEEGIINHPVSKVGNPINKIDFMIKRLGLTDNPVFIYHKNSILLSMPGHLSLTGNTFISEVSLKEFTQFGNINWSADLWNQELMFGGPNNNNKDKTNITNSINRIKKEIEDANKAMKNANIKTKISLESKIKSKEIALQKEKEKLEKLTSLQNSNNFTSNTQRDKLSQYQNDYVMQHPKSGGRYNAGMNPSGYYKHEVDQRNRAISNSNHLQQQIIPNHNQIDQLPRQEFHQPIHQELNHHNDFMENPYIQNRFSQLAHSNQNRHIN